MATLEQKIQYLFRLIQEDGINALPEAGVVAWLAENYGSIDLANADTHLAAYEAQDKLDAIAKLEAQLAELKE